MQYVFFLGHQPHLSLAELEARFGADSIQSPTNHYAVLKLNRKPDIDLLGGTTKISQIIKTEDLEEDLQSQIKNLILKFISEQKTEKLKLGLSIYSGTKNIKVQKSFVQRLLDELRELVKSQLPDLNFHTVAAKSSTLNTAQIVHSGLLKNNGLSLDILINPSLREGARRAEGSKNQIILAKTTQVPNLKKYTLRDYGKPKPSGSNGMLPPKLAQIMLNLSQIKPEQTVLDPFCGSGTVLQEALLQNINAIGTDLNPKIIEDAKENLDWLSSHPSLGRAGLRSKPGGVNAPQFSIFPADATSHTWVDAFDAIVCEGYLGEPLSKEPTEVKLRQIITECNSVAEKFLTNIHRQISSEQTIVIALPCWFIQNKIHKLPVVEKLSTLGYNQRKYVKVKEDLVYHRSGKEKSQQRNQLVGRDIYILNKR